MGALLIVVVVGAFWDRRMRFSGAVIGVLVGIVIVFHRAILGYLSGIVFQQRVRLVGVMLGLAVLCVTIQAVRCSYLYKRYAVFWLASGAGLVLGAIRLESVRSLANLLEVHVLALLGGGFLVLMFLLLFHFSLVLTRLEKQNISLLKQLRLSSVASGAVDDIALDEQTVPWSAKRLSTAFVQSARKVGTLFFSANNVGRAIRGTQIGAPLTILLASLAVLFVGLAAPQAMVGDEVTHYYMLVKQAQDISTPNFYSEIPMASGGMETRRYPHSFVWHYLGALVYLVTGGSFIGVQLYQTFFLIQLLTVAYLLARSRGGVESRSALLYVLVLASLPLCLIFSVAFYQDVPMAAQALTAFYMLSRRRWFVAAFFMALAIGFKVTAVLFFPAFFFLVLFWEARKGGLWQGTKALVCAALIVLGATWTLGKTINIYAQSAFYPQEKLEILAAVVKNKLSGLLMGGERQSVAQVVESKRIASTQYSRDKSPETAPVIIANNPGDLRIKENYLVYGGIILWMIFLAGGIASLPRMRPKEPKVVLPSNIWLFGVGGSFLLLTAYLTKTAPDARFFLPGLPFILLPAVERVVHFPKPKALIIFFASLALLQGGYVLMKAYRLRGVSSAIYSGIEYLKVHPPSPGTIFMYPEGNYRLFPVPHEWYLGYRLRDFWRADNDKRIEMLHQHGIGAIVIKKHLIAPLDEQITNLGVYPPQFVTDLQVDDRFVKSFENDDLLIFLPPAQTKIE